MVGSCRDPFGSAIFKLLDIVANDVLDAYNELMNNQGKSNMDRDLSFVAMGHLHWNRRMVDGFQTCYRMFT